MTESLAYDLLDAHRPPERGRAGARGPRPARASFRADHVVIEGHAAALALRSFETLGLERHAVELALACAEEDPIGRHAVAEELAQLERAARRFGVLLSRPGNGAAHQVYAARFGAPGRLTLGTSPRLAACGALGAVSLVVSPTEAAAALAGAAIELPSPEVAPIRLFGRPAEWLSGDDVALELERLLAFAPSQGRVLEFQLIESGALPFADRMAIATRAPLLGSVGAVFPSDEVTRAFLRAQGREADWKPLAPSTDDQGGGLDLDFSDLEPAVAVPGSGGVLRLRDLGERPVSAVWVGPEASLADLERLARRLAGTRVAAGIDCLVTLGSRQLHETAAQAGLLGTLRAAGVRIGVPRAFPRPRPGSELALACGAPGARAAGWHETGVTACAAAAIAAVVSDPRQWTASGEAARVEAYVVDDRLLERPPSDASPSVEVVRDGAPWPRSPGITGPLRGAVLLKLGDHVGIDRILPWGARVRPLASDIERLAAHMFASIDPHFAARARAEAQGWVVAGRDFGLGPRREEAALVAVALGVRGMLARSFDPEFRTLLRQHGVLGLRFGADGDLAAVAHGDELEIPDLPEGLEEGKPLVVRNLTRGAQVALHHDLDEAGVREVRAGGLLAALRLASASAPDPALAARDGRRAGA